jgi:hypothetical protein
LPKHLIIDRLEYKGLVNKILDRKWVCLKINELLVVEYSLVRPELNKKKERFIKISSLT